VVGRGSPTAKWFGLKTTTDGEAEMSSARSVPPEATDALRADVTGHVFVPDDSGFHQARQAFILTADQRPAMVVEAASAADVAVAVRFARSHGLRIAPQGTGHGAAPLEELDSALLLRTSQMRGVRIDPDNRTARADAGALWQDVADPASSHGLAGLAGSSLLVGVTGYTLGGGIGWLARSYGLAANSVTAAEIVTPDGQLVRADSAHEPDLFWAVRGGGGGVGVVTALEMMLYPVPELYAGVLFFPIQRAAEVLQTWHEWVTTMPDEVTSIGRILRLPPSPAIPDQLRGRAFALVEAAYTGDERTGADLIAPLRKLGPEIDTFATIPAPALSQLHMDPTEPVPAVGDGALLTDFPAAAVDAVVGLAGADANTMLVSVEVRHLDGALRRPAAGGGALPAIDASYVLYGTGVAPAPEAVATVSDQAQALKRAVAPWHASYNYYNSTDTPAPAQAVLPPDSYQRLKQIKARNDPDDAIISAHPV
jgi:FAD/FMN-containing dehydrogenase